MTDDGIDSVLDACLRLHKVERGVHGRYQEHLRFLARCLGQLSDADARLVGYLLDREGWLDDDGDD